MSNELSARPLVAFSDDLADIVERVGASVVALQARRSYPSSALILKPGVIVTAEHTLRREDGISAVLPDGSSTTATLVGVDPTTDVAVLRLESAQGIPVTFGDAATVRPGNVVVAVARSTDGALAASAGVVGRTGGEWRTWRGGSIDRRIELDGRLWAGFSGGPVVDARGAVIGIGTSALSRSRAVVIPVSVLQRVSEQLLVRGRVSHAYLGAAVQAVELPSALRARLGNRSTHGLIVVSTVDQGPADQAGIMLGDTLLTVGEKRLVEVDDLKAALNAEQIGSRVRVTLARGGQSTNVDVTIGERPHKGS